MLDPTQTIQIFQKHAEPKVFAAGSVIFEQGQPVDFMYGILEGEVDVVLNGKVVETLKPGQVFGAGALIRQDGRRHTAIARTDCKLAYLDESRFLFAVQETPMFALEVLKAYADRLDRIDHLTSLIA
ncbi:MAG TPA: cyclic nucleotide-binding domain-containing protein [Synechococcales cyanobacterium M55_K2018_004]|nr:cyclic nucleotide-binding domain-containing protein [Synechococcales cyanobacterium M55_K2018_004]